MKKSSTTALLHTLALTATVVINALANALPINGLNTGEVSALYPNLFTPAGYTFSVWSLIYILLVGFVAYHWYAIIKKTSTAIFETLSPWFILSCIFNVLWILVWHHLYVGLSIAVMIALLGTLVRAFIIVCAYAPGSRRNYYFIVLPFVVYLAWICVATIANAAALLTAYDWQGGFASPVAWAVIMMIIAALLAIFITTKFYKPAFAFIVAWAIGGILARWSGSDYTLIIYTATFLVLTLVITGAVVGLKRRTI